MNPRRARDPSASQACGAFSRFRAEAWGPGGADDADLVNEAAEVILG